MIVAHDIRYALKANQQITADGLRRRDTVDGHLRVEGSEDIFAFGDVALCPDAAGTPLPGLAQVAKQRGIYLGGLLVDRARGELPTSGFVYRSRGNTAIIGRHAAIFESGRIKLKGWVAWMTWALVHVYLLVGFQHRVQVSLQWLGRYLTYERGARLIAEAAAKSSSNRADHSL